MIICHPLRLIFIKTKKVGGTSFEIALSKFCGPDCIIAPIGRQDEDIRKQLGFRGPQNHTRSERIGFARPGHPNEAIQGDFSAHDTAEKIHTQIGVIFDQYLTVSIHREPMDFLVSQYFQKETHRNLQKTQRSRTPFAEWYFGNRGNVFRNDIIAPRRGPHACDVILRYENLADEISKLDTLPHDFLDTFSGISAKGSNRDENSRDARKFFVDNGLADEIEWLQALPM